MKGKDKCNYLKKLRNKIAKENNIDYHTDECSFKGDCLGTCPKCEAELKELTKKIAEKKVIAGISIGVAALGLVGCTDTLPNDDIVGLVGPSIETTQKAETLSGDVDVTLTTIGENEGNDESKCEIEGSIAINESIEGDVEYLEENTKENSENNSESVEDETIPTNYDIPIAAGVAPPENMNK